MTSRITISVATNAPNGVLIKGGPGPNVAMDPGETRVIDIISGFAYSFEEGKAVLPAGPLPEAATGKPSLQGG